jgi:hypothetical protein
MKYIILINNYIILLGLKWDCSVFSDDRLNKNFIFINGIQFKDVWFTLIMFFLNLTIDM